MGGLFFSSNTAVSYFQKGGTKFLIGQKHGSNFRASKKRSTGVTPAPADAALAKTAIFNFQFSIKMAQLRILVIEDDPIHASRLEIALDELGYQLIGVVAKAADAIRLYKATKPDLVLMDIGLKGETEDGIDISEKLKSMAPCPIIYTTSFIDDATFERAKSTEPYAYLVKPIEKASLKASIELAIFHFGKQIRKDDQSTKISKSTTAYDCFFVKTINGLEKIPYEDVFWISVISDRYCEIITKERNYSLRTSLKQLEEKLPAHQFVRTHRSFIVNIQKVDGMHDQGMTLGIGKHRIPIGQGRKQAIIEMLNIF